MGENLTHIKGLDFGDDISDYKNLEKNAFFICMWR